MDSLGAQLEELDGKGEIEDNSIEESREVDLEQGEGETAAYSMFPLSRVSKCMGMHARMPSIWRVPARSRKVDPEAYEPKLVSIGPIHHKDEHLVPMDEEKLKTTLRLLADEEGNILDIFVEEMLAYQSEARAEYSDNAKPFTDDVFARMLVVDGCFIVALFLGLANIRGDAISTQVQGNCDLLYEDLMLLENQVPFFILTKLYNKIAEMFPEFKEAFPDFMSLYIHVSKINFTETPEEEDVKHILHLYHMSFDPNKILSKLNLPADVIMEKVRNLRNLSFGNASKLESSTTIPSAKELYESGIKFKKKVAEGDDNTKQLKISYNKGTLEIPQLFIDHSTGSRMRNYIAFEQCYRKVSSHFTDYCIVMDQLINNNDDARILRTSGILKHGLGSDAEVTAMFNSLCKQVRVDWTMFSYGELFTDLNDFFEKPYHWWKANLRQNYFYNPWSTLSVVAAVILLVLTCIQAFFSAFPRGYL